MISRITGRLAAIHEFTVSLEVGGLWYELLLPAMSISGMQNELGKEVTFVTLHYLEGNLAGGNLIPRLIGFASESDRAFFQELTKIRGISTRKALRAMALPVHEFAAAIERGDELTLRNLPEIGKKTATQIITELRGQVQGFLAPAAAATATTGVVAVMTEVQRVALEILVSWGDRRADAQRWISAAVEQNPALDAPDAIVRAAYRVKQGAG